MSFDVGVYVAQYRGRTQLERALFVAQQFPAQHDACLAALLQALGDAPQNAGFLQRAQKVFPEIPAAFVRETKARGDATMATALGTYDVLRAAVATGDDGLTVRTATKLGNELEGRAQLPVRERLDALLGASLAVIGGTISTSNDFPLLCECEAIVAPPKKGAVPVAASGAATTSAGAAATPFYPTPTDVLRCRLMRAQLQLANGDAAQCARTLLAIPRECCGVPDARICDIATWRDVVLCASVAALATMDRAALREHVVENANYREWATAAYRAEDADASAPAAECALVCGLVDAVHAGQWGAAWAALDAVRPLALRDVHLARAAPALLDEIAARLLLQYCRPRARVALATMAAHFGVPLAALEPRLVALVLAGRLAARIDTVAHTLARHAPDARPAAFAAARAAGAAFDESAHRDLLYANLVDDHFLDAHPPGFKNADTAAAFAASAAGDVPLAFVERFVSSNLAFF